MAKISKYDKRRGARGPRACSARAIKRSLLPSRQEIRWSAWMREVSCAARDRSRPDEIEPGLRAQARELKLAFRLDRPFKIKRLWRALRRCPDAPELIAAQGFAGSLLTQSFEWIGAREAGGPGARIKAKKGEEAINNAALFASGWAALARFGVDFRAPLKGAIKGVGPDSFELKALSENGLFKSGAAKAALIFWKSMGGEPKREGALVGVMEQAALSLGQARGLAGLELVLSVWPELFSMEDARAAIKGLAKLCDEVEAQALAQGALPTPLGSMMSRHSLSLASAMRVIQERGLDWLPDDGSFSQALHRRGMSAYLDMEGLERSERLARAQKEAREIERQMDKGAASVGPPRM